MNKPIDPISVRQARQGKPVLVILTISLVLAVVAGGVLWGAIADDAGTAFMEPDPETMAQSLNQQTPLDAVATE